MEIVRTESRHDALFYACVVVLSAIIAGLSMWALASEHRPLEYMVAGTLATGISLLAIFLWLTRRRPHADRDDCSIVHATRGDEPSTRAS